MGEINNTHSEFDTKRELEDKRKKISSYSELSDYIKDIEENNYGYGSTPRAIAQACLAVGWYLSKQFGITGFQADLAMWDFIIGWTKTNNKTGLKLVDYDDMLYPQYGYRFEKTISRDTWEDIQSEAKNLLAEAKKNGGAVNERVYKHWKSIADGKIPFGYSLSNDY